MRILLIRLSAIGDCVLASPVPRALREWFPTAHITWAVEARAREVVEGLPGVDEVLVWNRTPTRAQGFLQALAEVRRRQFDVALDLQGLAKAGAFLAFSGAARRITGSRSKTLARRVATEVIREESPPPHAVQVYLGRAGALAGTTARDLPSVPLRSCHREYAEQFVRSRELEGVPLIAFNLGASKAAKRWEPERFAEVADSLLPEYGAHGVVLAAPWEVELAERMALACRHRARLHVAAGKTSLLQLAALAERCVTFVTADTGPMHIAAAVGVPVVALFGPSNPHHTGPFGAGHAVVDAVRILSGNGAPLPPARTRYGRRFGRVDDLSAIAPEHVVNAVHTVWQRGERRLAGANAEWRALGSLS